MSDGSKVYFISDVHLGVPDKASSLKREKLLVQWLNEIEKDAAELYIVGDLFDFWFEYKTAIPKHFTRVLGKLAAMSDNGLPIHFFTGNHDLWMFGYFQEELGIPVYKEPMVKEIMGKKFFIGHGDGLGPGDHGYKFLKKIFTNPLCQWFFRWLHPDIGIGIADYWSKRSRYVSAVGKIAPHKGDEEWLIQHARALLEKDHYDYFIYGHRHIPLNISLKESSNFVNLGDWITHFSYAEFDGSILELKYYRT